MKKIILFLALFTFCNLKVNADSDWYNDYNTAKDPNTKLIYNIEKFTVTNDGVDIQGWAFLDMVNTIAFPSRSQNYDLYIIALNKGDVLSYMNNPDNVDYYKKRVTTFYGENSLYSTMCYHIGSQNYCNEVFFGYLGGTYNPNGSDTIQNGEIKSGVPYASCSGGNTSCTHYNPYFKVSLKYSDIQSNVFISNEEEITFIIEISYDDIDIKTSGSGCVYNKNKSVNYFDNCKGNGENNRTDSVSRVLTITDDAYGKNGILSNIGNLDIVKNINCTYQLKNVIEYGLIRYYNGTKFDIYQPTSNYAHYFSYQTGSLYDIVDIDKITVPKKCLAGFGGSTANKVYYYGVEFDTNPVCSGDTCYHPHKVGGMLGYAPSTWGGIEGYISITVKNVIKKPGLSDCLAPVGSSCEYDKTISCPKYVYKSIKGDEDNLFNDKLNVGCSGETSITVYKIYDFVENLKLNYNENLFDQTKKFWPGIKLDKEFRFNFNRIITISPSIEHGETYYEVKFNKNISNNPSVVNCDQVSGLVNYEYLTNRGIYLDSSSIDFEGEIQKQNEKLPALYYDYLNSNDSNYRYDVGNSNIIDSIADGDSYTLEGYKVDYQLKNAFINKKSSKVEYRDYSVSSDEDNPGKYYFIPFNVDVTKKLEFTNVLKDVSLLVDNVNLNSKCSVDLENGNLETMKYRVINISKPFPNKEPQLGVYASNWYELYNKDNNILWKRYDVNDSVEYVIDLDQNDIKDIREHNKKLFVGDDDIDESYLYLNAPIEVNGKSNFINKYLDDKYKNAQYSILGESGVDW